MTISLKSLGGGSGGNGFSLLVGSSGNTTFTFDTDQPAGAYSISSQLSDTTFDIYLVTSGNENAGYTNSGALEATAAFNRVVVYGATTNDILNFEYKASASPATKGDVADGAAPFLTSATPTTLDTIDGTTTVTGGNFAADVTISFTGQDAIVVPAKSVVRSSSTELIVTRPDAFLVAQEPFSMTATNAGITNPSVVVNKLTDYFDAGSGLVWVTTSPLAGFATDSAYSDTLEATDVDGGAITYAVTTGSLPTGLSLNASTGVISGTPTGTSAETFTVTATDAGGNSSPREFLLESTSIVSYLVAAGGAGGGFTAGGGGGAGGYRTSAGTSGGGASAETNITFELSTNYTITVGAGGAGGTFDGSPGSVGVSSVFGTITTVGGGRGEHGGTNPTTGGSGGGAGYGTGTGGAGTPDQGYAGGNTTGGLTAPHYPSSGGGGAGAVGAGNSSTTGGSGGNGVASSITGTSVVRAGGGGGNGGTGGSGGTGGGGDGGQATSGTAAQNGDTNFGGGGGGGRSASGAGNGGSGIVILKYADSFTATFSGGVTHTTPPAAGGFKVSTITATSTTSETVSFA